MSRDYAGFDKEKLVNYLFMRLLLSNAQYLPTYSSSLEEMPVSYIFTINKITIYYKKQKVKC